MKKLELFWPVKNVAINILETEKINSNFLNPPVFISSKIKDAIRFIIDAIEKENAIPITPIS